MKYYSEVTKKMYDSVKELEKAESELNEKVNMRKNDALLVEKAYDELMNARKKFDKQLNEFCSKHGPYHKTITPDKEDLSSFNNLGFLIDLLEL